MDGIYLDHNSTTPTLPEVVEAMRPYWGETFANPASAHRHGGRARKAIEAARETVAKLIGALPEEVVFTSGATEANNLALFGLAGELPTTIVTSPIEHPSIVEPIAQLAKRGHRVIHLPVDPSGILSASSALSVFQNPNAENAESAEKKGLAAVMLANNETGAIQPVGELVAVLNARYFHCDAVQAVGKIPVHFHQLAVTTLSLSAHKFNGPRGIGALLVRNGTRLKPLFHGGHQQQGLRPGTEPVALAVGLVKALELAHDQMAERTKHVLKLRTIFLDYINRHAAPVVLNGPHESGLPHTANLSFPGCNADALLMKLDLAGIACSTGSACSSGSLLPSPVLKAMACPSEVLHSAMRFSWSHLTTEAEIEEAARRIAKAVQNRLQTTDDEA